MSDIRNQLIKDSFDYVIQVDLSTGYVYRVGGEVPVNPIFSSGLTVYDSFTFKNGSENSGLVLTSDANGNATWAPLSSATGNYLSISGGTLLGDLIVPNLYSNGSITGVTISGGTFYGNGSGLTNVILSISGGTGISATTNNGVVTVINTSPDRTVTITGGTNIQIAGIYPNFGVNYTGETPSGNYVHITGDTMTGDLIVPKITANTLNANQTINFPTTTGSTYGVINQDGRRLLHTYGTRNIFLGNISGNFTASTGVTGIIDNIGIGVNTLNGLTTGKRNIGMGLSSLISNTTGSDNIGIGNGTLQVNITGNYNVGIGQYSLQASTASRNTGIGYQSLYSNVTGAGNVAIGYNAGYNETGSNKLHIANTDTKTLIYGEFDNNRVGINTTSLSNAFTVSGSTDPIKLIGLQPANDNNLLTVDGTGVVHTYSLTALTPNLYLPLSGGTVTGRTTFQSGLTANAITATTISSSTITANAITSTTISASTYNNLPNTLYTGNGTLSSPRTVNQNELSLTFTGTTAATLSILEKFKQGSSNNNPSGVLSHAQGLNTTASGDYSHAEGLNSFATGLYSHAEGISTAPGTYSHSEGNGTAQGTGSHAEGIGTSSIGQFSHAEGQETISSGDYSHVEGFKTRSVGTHSHAEGSYNNSSGDYSHAEGFYTNSVGLYSHSEGTGYIIDGSNTFEPLVNNPLTYFRVDVSGVTYESYGGTWLDETSIEIAYDWSSIPGDSIISRLIFNSFDVNLCYYGPYHISKVVFDVNSGQSIVTFDKGWSGVILSSVTGCTNISNGIGSHSEGLSTRSNGNYSHSEGIGTYADGEGQHVSGKYNVTGNTNSLFVIGNGTDDFNRSDILNVNQSELVLNGHLSAYTASYTGSVYFPYIELSGSTSAFGLNYFDVTARESNTGIAARFNANGDPSGYGYSFQFVANSLSNQLLFVGDNTTQAHYIHTDAFPATEGWPLIFGVAGPNQNWNTNSDLLVLTSGQTIGIGVRNPTNKLHISGATDPIRIEGLTGSTTDDLILTIDSTGVVHTYPISGLTGGTGGGTFTGGTVTGPANFTNGLTANTISASTYQNLPVSAVTSGTGISATTSGGVVTIINTAPNQTVTITGGTNIQITGSYPNFGIAVTGTTSGSGAYLPLSGGTMSGDLITPNITANTLNATGLTTTNGITSTGGITFKQVTINSSYTATTSDYMIDVTGGTFSLVLPSAVGIQGRLLVVKNNGGGAVTVQPVLGQNIDDKPFVILGETNTIQLASNGANWVAISYNISTVNSSTGVFAFTGL